MSVVYRSASAEQRMLGRLVRLYAGLVGFGASMAMMVRAGLGLGPWDVLHHGLSRTTGLRMGVVVILVSALVLVLWVPLRQRPGLGTLSNVLVVGLTVDAVLAVLPAVGAIGMRVSLLASGILLSAVATALYIGAGLGPGPRDGLMTGFARRGHSIRAVRTGIELTALLAGVLLGGRIGVGTIAFALSIGPLVHVLMPLLDHERRRRCSSA